MSLPRSRQSSALHPPRAAVVDAVARALSEDLLPAGDITASLLPGTTLVTAELVSRQEGILAGSMCVT
ncbi:MAG: hypothetical protein ACRD1G_17805, partial [Acidimicrobiales bacterium]